MFASIIKLFKGIYEILFVKPVKEYISGPFDIIVIDIPWLISNRSGSKKESKGLVSSSPFRFVGISPTRKSDLNWADSTVASKIITRIGLKLLFITKRI